MFVCCFFVGFSVADARSTATRVELRLYAGLAVSPVTSSSLACDAMTRLLQAASLSGRARVQIVLTYTNARPATAPG